MANDSYSIVEYYAEQEKHKCGYCKSPNTNFSHGMWAHSLTVVDYQALIDRGWRRSGSYCYKPTMDQICCPTYTIKCEALQFKISKSQKKILKRMSKFLRNELLKDDLEAPKDDHIDDIDMNATEIPHFEEYCNRAQKNVSKMNVSSVDVEINGKLTNVAQRIAETEEQSMQATSTFGGSSCNRSDGKNSAQSQDCADSKPPCKKAKFLRIERKQNKLMAQGKSPKEIESMLKDSKQRNNVKSLEELFDEVNNGTTKLELKLVRTAPMSSEYLETSRVSYEVYKKYQTTIHRVQEEKVTEQQYTRFLVKSPLQMKLVRVMSEDFLSTLDQSASLYEKYQVTIHGDQPEKCDKKSFFNFLVASPLQQWKPQDDGPPQGYGSFHEQYWINNELIAVGVIDILPSCISSVYFFYDPAYSQLSLGTFSSLREIYLTRQLNKVANNLKYYYMGYYIHTCPKMRYKARMRPSLLLCPETYVWCSIEPALAKLDKERYCRLNEDIDAIDEDAIIEISKVLVLHRGRKMPYRIYKMRVHREIARKEEDDVKEYASLVGMKCAQNLLLYRGD